MQKSSRYLLASLFFLVTSCGWKLDPSLQRGNTRTVSVPYVEGDESGRLTSQLVESLQKSGGHFRYVSGSGSLVLKVRLVDDNILNIGFRLDPNKDEKKILSNKSRKKNDDKKILPNESRKKLLAEVIVLQQGIEKPLLGPIYIKASVDYDHQHYAINNKVNVFSLGQLTDIDTARDGLDTPMFRALSDEIVQHITMSLQ